MAGAGTRRARIPASVWIASYSRAWLGADVVAGLTTAAVVVPKAMAYATIAGLPPQVGLYTAFLPMVVYAALGTSRVLSTSTTTTLAILGASALGAVTRAHPDVGLVTATATLTALVGLVLLLARLFRLGFVANFISDPVLAGFKAGIGLVIVADQLPKLLGLHVEKTGFFRDLIAVGGQLSHTSLPTLLVAVGTFLAIVACERRLPRVPAPLLAVAVGIAASVLLGLRDHGVATVGAIPGGFPRLTLPEPRLALEMWPAAAGIALMSFTETVAAGRAFVRAGDPRPDSDQELMGLGAANLAGGLFGAMPAGGGTSQTSVNVGAGARTPLASLVTAAAALAVMLFLAPVLAPMPSATLAAVVIAYSIGLVSPAEIRAIRAVRHIEFRWALAAFAGVVLLGTLPGILVAVLLSMASLMHLANNPPILVLGRKRGTNVFRPRTAEHPDDESFEGMLLLKPEGRLYFGNAAAFESALRAHVEREHPRVVVLDCGAVPGLEYTALRRLIELEASLSEQGVELWLAALNPEAIDLLRRTPLAARLGRARMHFTVEAAVEAYRRREAGDGGGQETSRDP